TKYREGLYELEGYDGEKAEELLNLVEDMQKRFLKTLGTRFVFASDEFYALSHRSLPGYDAYEGFPQIENGVGLMRSFEEEINQELKSIKNKAPLNGKYVLLTGTLAEGFLLKIKEKILSKFKGLDLDILAIENDFFRKSITVSGLVTGQDIIKQFKEHEDIDGIIIPKSMLRADTEVFLDDLTIKDIEN